MESEGRVRISLSSGELEIEGSSEFVKLYEEAIGNMLVRLVAQPLPPVPEPAPSGGGVDSDASVRGGGEEGSGTTDSAPALELGEALHRLAKNATGTDKILVAAFYVQKQSSDSEFTTASANKLLIEQGIKLSNAAQAVRNSVESRRVFKVRGKKWRISKAGIDYLATLGVS